MAIIDTNRDYILIHHSHPPFPATLLTNSYVQAWPTSRRRTATRWSHGVVSLPSGFAPPLSPQRWHLVPLIWLGVNRRRFIHNQHRSSWEDQQSSDTWKLYAYATCIYSGIHMHMIDVVCLPVASLLVGTSTSWFMGDRPKARGLPSRPGI